MPTDCPLRESCCGPARRYDRLCGVNDSRLPSEGNSEIVQSCAVADVETESDGAELAVAGGIGRGLKRKDEAVGCAIRLVGEVEAAQILGLGYERREQETHRKREMPPSLHLIEYFISAFAELGGNAVVGDGRLQAHLGATWKIVSRSGR